MTKNQFDDLVERWFLFEWTGKSSFGMSPHYDPYLHGDAWNLEVVTMDGGWECGCYSEWTRDDQTTLTAKVSTRSGEIEVRYGKWRNFPDFVEAVVDFGRLEDVCSIERGYNEDEDD